MVLTKSDRVKRLTRLLGIRQASSLQSVASRSRPQEVAKEMGIETLLLTHRRKLKRCFIFSIGALFAAAWLVELVLRHSRSPQDWLHHNSLSHQVVFALAWGHYLLQLWEDFQTAVFLMSGISRLLVRKALYPCCCVEASRVMLLSYTFQTLLSLGILTLALFYSRLPGLAVACLFLESPKPLLAWREIGLARNSYPRWMNESRTITIFWCCSVPFLLLRFCLPLLWILMFANVLNVELDQSNWIIIHALGGIVMFANIRLMLFLLVAAESDLRAKNCRHGQPLEVDKKASSKLTYRMTFGRFMKKQVSQLPPTIDAPGKQPSSFDQQSLSSSEENCPVSLCFVNELPPVPKESNIGATKSVIVASSPTPIKGREHIGY